MSRRRRPQTSDSLELLLDTLCNTFGGVLFIAMLVVVLLQMAGSGTARGRPADSVSAEELEELADELEVLSREHETLARLAPGTDGESSRRAGTTDDASERLSGSLARLKTLQPRKDELLVETGRRDAAALAAAEQLAGLDGRLARAEAEAREVRQQVEKARKASARTIHTPLMHRNSKELLGVELRYDRLYILHEFGPSGERLGPNLDDYVLLDATGDPIEVTADPGRGLPVVAGPSFAKELRSRLSRFPAGRWSLDLVVRGRSFGSFHVLRQAARELGYEMRVLLLDEDGLFQDRGGTRDEVQ